MLLTRSVGGRTCSARVHGADPAKSPSLGTACTHPDVLTDVHWKKTFENLSDLDDDGSPFHSPTNSGASGIQSQKLQNVPLGVASGASC